MIVSRAMDKAIHLTTADLVRVGSTCLSVTSAQLMRPGINQNMSCAVNNLIYTVSV